MHTVTSSQSVYLLLTLIERHCNCVRYRKHLADRIIIVDTYDSRITCIELMTEIGSMLLLNGLKHTCQLRALIIEYDSIQILIAGDFNCNPALDSSVNF